MQRYAVPKLGDCLFISIFAGALVLGSRMLNQDSDLGRHLALGNYMLETQSVPDRDILSFTEAGLSRPPYEWLSQVVFALAYRALNLDGVVLLTALVIAASFLILYRDSLERSRAPILALVITICSALASSLHWLTRPHVFSFLLFAIWLRGLERVRMQQAIPAWHFPLLMLVWANAHGGFLYGLLAWAAYVAAWLWQTWQKTADKAVGIKLLVIGASSFLASMVTPALWRNWSAVLQNRSAYILSRTVETKPPAIAAPGTWPFLALLALTILWLVLGIRRSAQAHWFLLAGLGVMSMVMARNIPFFAIAAAPILTQHVAASLGIQSRWQRLENTILGVEAQARGFVLPLLTVVAATAWLSLHLVATRATVYAFDPRIFPVAATDWLETHTISGPAFNDLNWGGYLLYRLWPQQRVFIDSQSDFYGEALTREYEQIVLGRPGWQQSLGEYQINWIFVPTSSGLSAKASTDPAWKLLYADPLASIYGKAQTP